MLAVSQAKPWRAAVLLQLVAPMSADLERSSRTNHAYRISHGSALACKSFASVRIKIPQQACAGLAHGSMPSLTWLGLGLSLSLSYPNGLAVLLSWLVNLQLTHKHTHRGRLAGRCGCGCAPLCEQFHYEFLARLIGGYVRSLADAS